MATTTPNFGWTVPTSTDLVKNGATAIETLGDGIDASLVDLKGGTTGQILSKASNTDLDYTWIANDQGDITAVTAGTGISGGGTSGAVTVTNSMATAIDSKGDLVVGTGADAFSRIGVGANGTILTADSAEATGVKWAAPGSGTTFVGAKLFNSTTIAVNNNTTTTVTFDSETFDTDTFHSTSTNTSRITIPSGKAGKYSVIQSGFFIGTNSTGYGALFLFKNGTQVCENYLYFDGNGKSDLQLYTTVIDLAVGDYIETRVSQTSGGTLSWYPQASYGQFTVTYLGA